MNYIEKQKLINFLSEAAGVPDNIYETSKTVYENFVAQLSRKRKDMAVSEVGTTLRIKLPLRIADYDLPTVEFNVFIKEHPKVKDFEIIQMSIASESEKPDDNTLKMRKVPSKKILIRTLFVAPENFEWKNFIEYLKNSKNELVEDLSHELKHAYDHFKGKYESPIKRAEYNAYAGRSFGIPSVDEFFHDLYFITLSENLVRPTEVVSAIRNNEISQKDFIDFLKKNTTYITLKRISNFDLEKFKEKIRKDMKYVDKLLKHLGKDIKTMDDDEKIDEVLRLIYVNLGNWKAEALKEILTSHFMEELLGFQGEKQKLFNKFANRVTRFKNHQEFFDYETKMFHYVANNMIKKIARVYSLVGKQ